MRICISFERAHTGRAVTSVPELLPPQPANGDSRTAQERTKDEGEADERQQRRQCWAGLRLASRLKPHRMRLLAGACALASLSRMEGGAAWVRLGLQRSCEDRMGQPDSFVCAACRNYSLSPCSFRTLPPLHFRCF
jgi:hypothetical protein